MDSEIVYVSTITIGELYAGFHGGKKYASNIEELKLFLSKDGVRIIDVTVDTAEIFGELKAKLGKIGLLVSFILDGFDTFWYKRCASIQMGRLPSIGGV